MRINTARLDEQISTRRDNDDGFNIVSLPSPILKSYLTSDEAVPKAGVETPNRGVLNFCANWGDSLRDSICTEDTMKHS